MSTIIDGTYYMRPRLSYVVHHFHTPNRQILKSMEIFRGWVAFKNAHGNIFRTQDSLYDHIRRHNKLPLKPFANKTDPRACFHIQKCKVLVPVYIKRSRKKIAILGGANHLELPEQHQLESTVQPTTALPDSLHSGM